MTEVKESTISRDLIQNAYSYEQYRDMIDILLKEGKTTGDNHTDTMIHYTKMNVQRMNRHDKRTELIEELQNKLSEIDRPMIWLVLTEAWCGDVAQSLPVINMMAEASDYIQLRLIMRDENPDVMDQFLQRRKKRSIPKLIMLDAETLEVLADWGPRPREAQQLFDTLRGSNQMAKQEVAEHLHKWYADNKSRQIQQEISEILENLKISETLR